MRLRQSEGFNKEKLIFLLTAVGLSGALYYLFASRPVKLEVGEQITAFPPPTPSVSFVPERQEEANFYVVDGQFTRLIDPRTGRPVDRKRMSPFDDFSQALASDPKKSGPKVAEGDKGPDIAPPPTPDAKDSKKPPAKVAANGVDIAPEVSFEGVITIKHQTCGILRPTDGTSSLVVKVGDVIDDYNYTVTKIDDQAIYVEDAAGHQFIINDNRLTPNANPPATDSGDAGTSPAAPDPTAAAQKTPNPFAPGATPPATPPAGGNGSHHRHKHGGTQPGQGGGN